MKTHEEMLSLYTKFEESIRSLSRIAMYDDSNKLRPSAVKQFYYKIVYIGKSISELFNYCYKEAYNEEKSLFDYKFNPSCQFARCIVNKIWFYRTYLMIDTKNLERSTLYITRTKKANLYDPSVIDSVKEYMNILYNYAQYIDNYTGEIDDINIENMYTIKDVVCKNAFKDYISFLPIYRDDGVHDYYQLLTFRKIS